MDNNDTIHADVSTVKKKMDKIEPLEFQVMPEPCRFWRMYERFGLIIYVTALGLLIIGGIMHWLWEISDKILTFLVIFSLINLALLMLYHFCNDLRVVAPLNKYYQRIFANRQSVCLEKLWNTEAERATSKKLLAICRKHIGWSVEDVFIPEDSFLMVVDGIRLDPVDMEELTEELQAELGLDLFEENICGQTTLRDVVDAIMKKNMEKQEKAS